MFILQRILVLFLAVLFATVHWQVQGKEPIMTPETTPVLGDLDHYLVNTLYKSDNRNASLAGIVNEDRFKKLIDKHNLVLFGGPMLGCVTETSARIWLRTPGSAEVQARVFEKGDASQMIKSNPVITTAENDFTTTLDVEGLRPDSSYMYNIVVDGEKVYDENLPAFQTCPGKDQKAVFSVGFGGGARYNPEKEKIWDVIASYSPDAFLFLGDNVYIDNPSRRNVQRVHYYRRQLRPEFRNLAESTSIYAIWDDHDFGNNDCAGGLKPFQPDWKLPVWRVFKENWNNPYYGGGKEQPGCWFDFSIGDVDFFMLDGRYYRSFAYGTMLGQAQKNWLLNKLAHSDATFKVIASPVQWTEHADKGGADSWWGVRRERERIFNLIDSQNIGGVILLSADRHRTDIFRMKSGAGYPLYEFSTSKLTNNHTHGTKGRALFSYNKGNFFGLLDFDFSKSDPEVTFQCITMDNSKVHELTLKRSQLEPEQ